MENNPNEITAEAMELAEQTHRTWLAKKVQQLNTLITEEHETPAQAVESVRDYSMAQSPEEASLSRMYRRNPDQVKEMMGRVTQDVRKTITDTKLLEALDEFTK